MSLCRGWSERVLLGICFLIAIGQSTMSMSMSMWSLRWHFNNKSVTEALYSSRSYSLSHSYGEEYDDWSSSDDGAELTDDARAVHESSRCAGNRPWRMCDCETNWLNSLLQRDYLVVQTTKSLRTDNMLPPGLRRPGLTFDSFRPALKTYLLGDRSA